MCSPAEICFEDDFGTNQSVVEQDELKSLFINFPPKLSTGPGFKLSEMLEILIAPWFHGWINELVASEILTGCLQGQFLLRCCHGSLGFFLSYKNQSTQILHYPIRANVSEDGFLFSMEEMKEKFSSLPDLVEAFRKLPFEGEFLNSRRTVITRKLAPRNKSFAALDGKLKLLNDISIDSKLSEGSFTALFKGNWGSLPVVCRKVKKFLISEQTLKLLTSLSHLNVIKV